MSLSQGTDYQDSYLTMLSERCGVLRLSCWFLSASEDNDGLAGLAAAGPGGDWLRSQSLHDRILEQVQKWLQEDSPQPVALEPGCWLVPALVRRGRRVTGAVAGITFEHDALNGDWFERICQETNTEPDAVRGDLAAFTWPGKADLDLLIQAFDQVVQDASQTQIDRSAIDEFSLQLLNTYEETNLLFRLGRLMNILEDPSELVPTCCHQILPIFPFNWIAVKFWESKRRVEGMTGVMVIAGEMKCDEAVFEKMVVEQFASKKHGDWTQLLQPDSGGIAELLNCEIVAETITHDGETVGVLMAGNKDGTNPLESEVTSGELQFIEAASNLIGVFHENIARFNEQKQLFMGTLRALTASIDAKDPYTRGHSERVAYMSARLADAMGMDPTKVELVHTTGLVHDVGKIGVPEAVLCKPGKLTDEEFEMIKQHPAIGYKILKGIPAIEPMLPGVLHHHERWDGRGYPHGLAGKDIPELGRVLALADTFDAMSSTRSYRPAMPRETVLEEIKNCAGTQFDPDLVPLFLKLDFSAYDCLVEKHRALSVFAA